MNIAYPIPEILKCIEIIHQPKKKFYKNNDKARKKIAKNGKDKYFKLFNETKISKYIIDKSIGKNANLF